jgi:DNA-binding XRE family transcriptional regulator
MDDTKYQAAHAVEGGAVSASDARARRNSPASRHGNDEVARLIGGHLRRLREQHGLSLERLAQRSGVSRAMLGQIELAKSVPTITVLLRIAGAFGVPITAFLERGDAAFETLLQGRDARASHPGTAASS